MNRLVHEYRVFASCPGPMRVLLIANMLFAFVMPVIDVFAAAYVLRNSRAVSMVIVYQLAVYTAIPLAFVANGFLLKKLSIGPLYGLGMLLSGASLVAMMSARVVSASGIALAGLLLGVATGLFAANRVLLAMSVTRDTDREYFYGLELFFSTLAAVGVPLAVGWFIEGTVRLGWTGGTRNSGYGVVALCACALSAASAVIVARGGFPNPPATRFLHFRFHGLWHNMQCLAVLKGLAQGYIVTAPAMLILLLVGSEGALGAVQAAGGLLSACLLYSIGRLARPSHRLAVFSAGLILFAMGAAANAALFSAAGVLVFMASLLVAKPLLDLAYFPIQMRVIDTVSALENRSHFAYFLNLEFAQYLGRALGCGLFLVFARAVSGVFALKFALLVVAALQLLSIWVARNTLRDARMADSDDSGVTFKEAAAL